jgi:hypothetical protein
LKKWLVIRVGAWAEEAIAVELTLRSFASLRMTTLIKIGENRDLRSDCGYRSRTDASHATDSSSDVVTPEILRFAQDDNAHQIGDG